MIEETDPDVYWSEIAPGEHLLQIYDETETLIDSLERYVIAGLRKDESVIVIARPQNVALLDTRLIAQGVDVRVARLNDRYLTWGARQVLSLFMVGGVPNEALFNAAIHSLLVRASAGNRNVRAFGEMVAILWSEGNHTATLRLEHLWHRFCDKHHFPLFCAYPKSGFGQNVNGSMAEICATHSRIVQM
jgi:hypothetical protein